MATPDPYVMCPYEKSHEILLSRLSFHLTTCAKNHPNSRLRTCPYNSLHRHLPEEMECEARALFLSQQMNAEPAAVGLNDEPSETEPVVAEVGAWEAELDAPGYDPLHSMGHRQVLRPPIGLSRAARRRFRHEQRRRFQNLQDDQTDESSDPSQDLSE